MLIDHALSLFNRLTEHDPSFNELYQEHSGLTLEIKLEDLNLVLCLLITQSGFCRIQRVDQPDAKVCTTLTELHRILLASQEAQLSFEGPEAFKAALLHALSEGQWDSFSWLAAHIGPVSACWIHEIMRTIKQCARWLLDTGKYTLLIQSPQAYSYRHYHRFQSELEEVIARADALQRRWDASHD